MVINTHKGLYQYTRMPFGISSAPAIFQRVMDTILQGLSNVLCYLDDILITGATDQEHVRNLEEVLKQLQDHGIKLQNSKCTFLATSVEYLGHVIDDKGLHTSPNKVAAIQNAPAPTNQQQLHSLLGFLHYYGKFIPNLAMLLHPMNQLLKSGSAWNWLSPCQQAFQQAKKLLSSATVLAHYNPSLPRYWLITIQVSHLNWPLTLQLMESELSSHTHSQMPLNDQLPLLREHCRIVRKDMPNLKKRRYP